MAGAMACSSSAGWSSVLPSSSLRKSGSCSVLASVTEPPKWKQKIAAAEEKTLKIKEQTLQAQQDYRRRQSRGNGRTSTKTLVKLSELELLPYLTEAGMINNCSEEGVKASLYAVFDEDKVLQYIGISRQIHHSMRLHFARMPQSCYFVKVYHTTTPNRSLLEVTRDEWIADSPVLPVGNVDPMQRDLWENPLDCKPVMTDEELILHHEAGPGPPKAKVLKNVARRIEKTLEAKFVERKCRETLRFDPKLKEKGLLDLKNISPPAPKKP